MLTCNVRGLHDPRKRQNLFLWLMDQKADIVFLQETFCTKELEPHIKSCWKGKVFNACSDSSHSRGVAILFKENFDCKIISTEADDDGRKILVNLEYQNETFSVLSIYAPNIELLRIEFFKNLCTWVQKYALN